MERGVNLEQIRDAIGKQFIEKEYGSISKLYNRATRRNWKKILKKYDMLKPTYC